MKPIVLATDGSPSAANATKVAVELALETGARLNVVAAWQTPGTIYASAPTMAMSDLDTAEIERATEAARAAVAVARADGVEAKSFVPNGKELRCLTHSRGLARLGPDAPARIRQRLDGPTPSRSLPRARGAVRCR